MLRLIYRWWPARARVVVADRGVAAWERLATVSRDPLSGVTRRRLEAALDEPAPERVAGRTGRPRKQGKRLATWSEGAAHPATRWPRFTVAPWYGEVNRTIAISDRCVVSPIAADVQ